MNFKCEEDSFLKSFRTKVVSCTAGITKWTPPGENKAVDLSGYNVVCEDTILFPEGGGQPCDYGTINGYDVHQVLRKDGQAVHFVETTTPFEEGQEVNIALDWERRLDHMQHHSGQHLITALFSQELSYETTSWWLGSDTCYVELDTKHLISRESLDLIERKANDLILEGRAVTIGYMDPDDAQEVARIRNIPKNISGLLRIVNIDGVEGNACCGTHVTNLTQLQCVKILHAEKSKNGVNVHFLFGRRVVKRLGECFQRELDLNLALKGGPHQHLELIQKLQANFKTATKSFERLLKEIAIAEADKVENLPKPKPKFYCLHRKDGIEPSFMQTFLRNAPDDILYFLTVSDCSGPTSRGQMMVRGDPNLVQNFGKRFLEILDGKGNGNESSFQGKFNNVDKIPECNAILEEHFKDAKPAA